LHCQGPDLSSRSCARYARRMLRSPRLTHRSGVIRIAAYGGGFVSIGRVGKRDSHNVVYGTESFAQQAAYLLSAYAAVHDHLDHERHLVSREIYKGRRSAALVEWRAVTA
jgi:hypothetical protein